MSNDQMLLALAIIITAVVIAGSVAKKLNLGSTVALLVVGMALGPHSPRPLLIRHIHELQTVGEIGVMLLLFLVGLDTQPKRLSSMRSLILGLGTAQYWITTTVIAGLLIAVYRAHWQSALIVSLGLAMSSDAVAFSSLEEHAESVSPRGRVVMAVSIYQDFVAIPVLAVIPLLAANSVPSPPMATVFKGLEICAAIAGVYLFARCLLPKALTFAARKQGMEMFAQIIIAAIFGSAWTMDRVGLSSALGAFMLGMVLSTSVFADQIKGSVSSIKGLLLRIFFIAIGMSINLRELAAIGGPLMYYLPVFFLIKTGIVIALALGFRLGFRTSVLAGLLLAPFDEIGYVIFASAHESGLLTERAYAMGLMGISFSFVVSPLLINLGYKLVERFPTEPNPDLNKMSEAIHDQVVVVGYSYVGRVICMVLEQANVRYIAFERRFDRFAEAKKGKHNVHYGDISDPAMMGALGIARARAVIVTTRDYSAVKRVTGTLLHFYRSVKVITAVPYLFQREELRKMGVSKVIALTPEGTLSFGRLVLGELGVGTDDMDTIISSLRADDYAFIRGVGGAIPKDAAEDAEAGKR
ncbi:MAG TPA: cation:proton antiporter [Candidatus Binataceae bacterium]|nr:cation:proton antiporter [Candidatus Binataceae bacterium]